MPSNLLFVSPFRDALLSRTRKRSRAEADDESDDSLSEDQDTTSQPLVGDNIRTMLPRLAQAYKTAGLSTELPPPPHPFPHKALPSATNPSKVLTPSEMRSQLEEIKPPLNLSETVSAEIKEVEPHMSFKRQHLDVVSAIMHKSLLKGDYARASRAWGMLLRAEVNGQPMDFRAAGLWGLGAELLLQKDIQQKKRSQIGKRSGTSRDDELDEESERPQLGREGFERAKNYYERLILQFPYYQWYPNAVSSLHFYPAMLGMWIYFLQEQHQTMLKNSDEKESVDSDNDDSLNSSDLERRSKAQVFAETRREAEVIAAELKELLLRVPYSADAYLKKLDSNIHLWIRDLRQGERQPG